MVVWTDEHPEAKTVPAPAAAPFRLPKLFSGIFPIRPKEVGRAANNRFDRRSRKEKGKPPERTGRKAKSLTRRTAGHAGR